MNFNFSNRGLMSELAGLFELIVFAVVIITVVVHVSFAIGVFQDASRRSKPRVLAAGPIWALATLIGGVFVATAYWLVHYSQLTKYAPETEEPPPPLPDA